MFKLDKLYLKNVMSFEEVSVDFSQRGLWIIQGHNQKGGGSNGAGKSAILSGLVWILFGKTQNGLAGKDIVRWGQNNCTGILKLNNNSQTYEIVRSIDSLEFFIDGQKQAGHKKDIQDLINKTFGTDYQLFLTFNIFTKAWSNFITEITDSNRKKLFKSILMLDQLDHALERSKEISVNLNIQANKTEGMIKQLSNTLPELEDILNKNKELADNEEKLKQKAIQELERQKEQLKVEIVDYTKDLQTIDEEINDIIKLKINETIDYATIKLNNINNLIFHDRASIADLEDKLSKIISVGGECPTCGQKILAKNKAVHIKHLTILRDGCAESLQKNEIEKKKIDKEIYNADKIQQRISELNTKKSEIERLVWQQESNVEKYNSFCKMADRSLENLRNSQTDYDKMIATTASKIEKIKIGLEYNTNLFNTYMREIDYYNYLQWLYSKQGVINLIIEKCFARLMYLTNRYLRRICSEGFKLEIAPQKMLKSGEYRDEVDIFIWDGNKKVSYANLSSGQAQRINTAILLSLYMWGREIGANSFDFLLLDEIMDLSLDDKGQEETLELIYNIRREINHIILISHKDIMKSTFDKEINVYRDEKGISNIT